jgi:hypothetical protein
LYAAVPPLPEVRRQRGGLAGAGLKAAMHSEELKAFESLELFQDAIQRQADV